MCVRFWFGVFSQGEIMMITRNYQIYHMPCGDLCASTCLTQSEDNVEVEVRNVTYSPRS